MRPASVAGMSTRLDRCAPTATNTASKPPSSRSAARSSTRWPQMKRTPSAAIRCELDLQHVAGQPVVRGCRSASSRPARRPRPGSRPRGPGAPGGRPRRARSGPPPMTSTRLPLRTGRRVEHPALLQREVAEEPLDRVDRDRAVEMRSVADGLARVIADPPVDCGERDCRRPADATLARGARPWHGRARPGCSRRPGSRNCTAEADRRRRVGACAPVPLAVDRATSPEAA